MMGGQEQTFQLMNLESVNFQSHEGQGEHSGQEMDT